MCGFDVEVFWDVGLQVDDEREEARAPRVFSDPGAPTEAEFEQPHLPFRAWCPCVEVKASDRLHRGQDGSEDSLVKMRLSRLRWMKTRDGRCCLLMRFPAKV